MSAPKLISPMLDSFIMGEPISDKDGVRCCPALHQQTQEKYIVKIISIPASQTQLDALLLTGAYKDAAAADTYFKELADATVAEVDALRTLSRFGGYEAFTDCQIVPMDDGTGYDVYLLIPYRRTWARHCQLNAVTQLEAHNLALDMCAALSAARRNGYLYVDLKPENIFLTDTNSYHIGDLGFVGLSYLKYSSLKQKYFSPYTAPELADAYSSINETLDVYALGMILYQVFNGGVLPFEGDRALAQEYPAPQYANKDMAEIILKAIDPDPALRWQDPTQMGQAIVACMQRNGVNDIPIVPVEEPIPVDEPQPADEEIAEEVSDLVQIADAITQIEEANQSEAEQPEDLSDILEKADSLLTENEEAVATLAETPIEEVIDEAPVVEETPVEEEVPMEEEAPVEEAPVEEAPAEEETPVEEKAPAEEDAPVEKDEEDQESDEETEETDQPSEESEIKEESFSQEDEESEDDLEILPDLPDDEQKPAKKKRWWRILIAIIAVLALLVGGYFAYTQLYLQEIDSLTVMGVKDRIEITVATDTDYSKLLIVCSDASGEQIKIPLTNGVANITGLKPDTLYTITVEINGFHKLIGATEQTYQTQANTVVENLSAVIGSEDGSALVLFDVVGPDSNQWHAIFKAEDEEEKKFSANSHYIVASGLTPDTQYQITLQPEAELFLHSGFECEFTSGSVISAQSPDIIHCAGGKLTVTWDAPEGSEVAQWTAKCYNDAGYETSLTVTETTATFDVPDDRKAYTVEIVATGQSVAAIASVKENSVSLSDVKADASTAGKATLTWSASTEIPEGGWIISYQIAGSDVTATATAKDNTVSLNGIVPGETYLVEISAKDETDVLHDVITFTTAKSTAFSGYGVSASNMIFKMCKRPAKSNWTRSDLKSDDYTTTFNVNQKASFLVRLNRTYGKSSNVITTLYVFRDSKNNVVHTCYTSAKWTSMWYNGYGELDIPSLPDKAGNYQITVYFNGAQAYTGSVTVK